MHVDLWRIHAVQTRDDIDKILAPGVLDTTTEFLVDLGFGDDFKIHGDWLFSRGLAIGLGLVVLWTLINVFIVLMYNLLSDIVGGIEVTLSERR